MSLQQYEKRIDKIEADGATDFHIVFKEIDKLIKNNPSIEEVEIIWMTDG